MFDHHNVVFTADYMLGYQLSDFQKLFFRLIWLTVKIHRKISVVLLGCGGNTLDWQQGFQISLIAANLNHKSGRFFTDGLGAIMHVVYDH